jgi:hypothetical protein
LKISKRLSEAVKNVKLNVKIPINKQLYKATAVIRKMSTYQRCFNFTHQVFAFSYNTLHKVSHSKKDRQYNGQKKKYTIQTTIYKTLYRKQKIAQHEHHQNKRLPNTNPPKQKIAQHEPHQNKRLPNTSPTKTKQQLKKTKDCGNLLFSLIVVLFWWGSCWEIFCFL